MNTPPTDTGPPNPQEGKSMEDDKSPTTKEETQNEIEKDSGYCDSSSDSLSSEGTPPPTTTPTATTSVTAAVPDPPQAQPVHTHIYILQNVVLKQPRVLLVQPPPRRHRKRAAPSSYLPILRSYPRIAPRQPSPSPAPNPPKETSPPPSKVSKQTTPQLLEVSMRSLALLRRTRETQRSIRELRAHARLYERALEGEEGGWERLRKTMETSGGYRKIPPPINSSKTDEAEGATNTTEEESITTTSDDSTTSEEEKPETEEVMTSPRKSVTSSESSSSSESETEGAV